MACGRGFDSPRLHHLKVSGHPRMSRNLLKPPSKSMAWWFFLAHAVSGRSLESGPELGLTFELSRLRRLAKPAVAGRLQRRVRRRFQAHHLSVTLRNGLSAN